MLSYTSKHAMQSLSDKPFLRIKKYSSYFLIRDWAGLKWHPVLKVWDSSKINTVKRRKTVIDESP